MPQLKAAEQLLGIDTTGMSASERMAVAPAKMGAGELVPRLRARLFPEDDDG